MIGRGFEMKTLNRALMIVVACIVILFFIWFFVPKHIEGEAIFNDGINRGT